ncbi:hypothetical protein H3S74_09855 [Gilliamella sp. W8126]|uniref:hypothetical protein n=1 Tax=Gilliamella sp. W8126 TaxID=2750946 RepID=UPI0018DCB167|nr:hypothetical protein [Gilliamella sp. W8126]MBI0006529.1 hypothetical protein [Gilliamella sp. W8126]
MSKFGCKIIFIVILFLTYSPVYANNIVLVNLSRSKFVFDPYAAIFVVVLIFVLLQVIKIWAIWKVKQWEKKQQQQMKQKKAERDRLFAESRARMRLKKQLTKKKSRKKKIPEK